MKLLIGMVTFGNLGFTKMAVRSIRETVKTPHNILIVVGKPGDTETMEWVKGQRDIFGIPHKDNLGFPASLNDIYDFAFRHNDYDSVVIMGNDTIALPNTIDRLVAGAERGYDWVSARELDVRGLVKESPEASKFFSGPDYIFNDFDARPWELAKGYKDLFTGDLELSEIGLSDCHNMTLFTRKAFDTIGYVDTNFFPAYYSDNDYVRRAKHLEIATCTVVNSLFFHFWSRTIKQESGGSNHKFFKANAEFYRTKWGGDFANETFERPFNGQPYNLVEGVTLQPRLSIWDRTQEEAIVNYWKQR